MLTSHPNQCSFLKKVPIHCAQQCQALGIRASSIGVSGFKFHLFLTSSFELKQTLRESRPDFKQLNLCHPNGRFIVEFLSPGSVLVVTAIWGVNLQMESLPVSLYLLPFSHLFPLSPTLTPFKIKCINRKFNLNFIL